jgi:hypothetical protein
LREILQNNFSFHIHSLSLVQPPFASPFAVGFRFAFPSLCFFGLFFLKAFCDISHRLGGITPFGVFSDVFRGLKMWVTFACATANFLPIL